HNSLAESGSAMAFDYGKLIIIALEPEEKKGENADWRTFRRPRTASMKILNARNEVRLKGPEKRRRTGSAPDCELWHWNCSQAHSFCAPEHACDGELAAAELANYILDKPHVAARKEAS